MFDRLLQFNSNKNILFIVIFSFITFAFALPLPAQTNLLLENKDDKNISKENNIDKEIRQLLLNENYETALQKLLENKKHGHFDIKKDMLAVVYCYVKLNRLNEAHDFVYQETENITAVTEIPDAFFIRGLVDCFNDNYGLAIISFTKEIEMLKRILENNNNLSTEERKEYRISLFFMYGTRAAVYAVRSQKNDVQKDMIEMNQLITSYPEDYDGIKNLPGYQVINKYLNTPEEKSLVLMQSKVNHNVPRITPDDPEKIILNLNIFFKPYYLIPDLPPQ